MKIKNYSNYEIYPENGTVYSLNTNKFIGCKTNKDYWRVDLIDDDGNKQRWRLHRLIWFAVNGELPDDYDVHHINENKDDNSISNLEIISHQDHVTLHWGDKKHTSEHIEKCIAPQRKQVAQYAISGELVNIWPSTKEAHRNGYDSGQISQCARGLRANHKGYIWKYTNNSPRLFV